MHQHSQQLIDMKTGHDIHLCESGFDVIHQCIERVRLVYVVCMWCVCGVYVVCMWCVCGVYVVCMWCLCGVYVVSMWCVCGALYNKGHCHPQV